MALLVSDSVLMMECFRYMNGASSNPDAHVVAFAAAQVKKGLEIAAKLGAENFGKYRISWLNLNCQCFRLPHRFNVYLCIHRLSLL